MQILQPQRIGSNFSMMYGDSRPQMVVTGLLGFSLGAPDVFLDARSVWSAVSELTAAGQPVDTWMPKDRREVLLWGRAFNAQPAPMAKLRLRCGDVERRVAVHGDRHWEPGPLGWRPSKAIPFTTMNLDWSRSFGGAAIAQCPVGCGAQAMAELRNRQPARLANLEPMGHPVQHPEDRAETVGFGAMHPSWLAAGRGGGRPLRNPGSAGDIDPEAFNLAQEAQRGTGFWLGGEKIELEGFEGAADLKSSIPPVNMLCFHRRVGAAAAGLEAQPMQADTVWLLPSLALGVLVFRAVLADPGTDSRGIQAVMLAAEWTHRPKARAHYMQAWERRTADPERADFVLADLDLMPQLTEKQAESREAAAAHFEALRRSEDLDRVARRRAQAAAVLGVTPAAFVLFARPTGSEAMPSLTREDVALGDVDLAGVRQAAFARLQAASRQAQAWQEEAQALKLVGSATSNALGTGADAENFDLLDVATPEAALAEPPQALTEATLVDAMDEAAASLEGAATLADTLLQFEGKLSGATVDHPAARVDLSASLKGMSEGPEIRATLARDLRAGARGLREGMAQIGESMEAIQARLPAQFRDLALDDAVADQRATDLLTALLAEGAGFDAHAMASLSEGIDGVAAEDLEFLRAHPSLLDTNTGDGLGPAVAPLPDGLASAQAGLDLLQRMMGHSETPNPIDLAVAQVMQSHGVDPEALRQVQASAGAGRAPMTDAGGLDMATAFQTGLDEASSFLESHHDEVAAQLAGGQPDLAAVLAMLSEESASDKASLEPLPLKDAVEPAENTVQSVAVGAVGVASEAEGKALEAALGRQQLVEGVHEVTQAHGTGAAAAAAASVAWTSVSPAAGRDSLMADGLRAQRRLARTQPLTPPSARRLPADQLAALLRDKCRRGEPLGGLDLEGANLQGIDLRGADLQGALLERANLAGADLRQARLSGAVLTGACLNDAILHDALCAGVNLNGVEGQRSQWDRADLTRASLVQADFTDASFVSARFDGCDATQIKAVRADFSHSAGREAQFAKADLTRATFGEARWETTTFVQARMDECRLTKSHFLQCIFTQVQGTRIDMSHARLEGSQTLGAKLADLHAPGLHAGRSSWHGSDLSGAVLDGAFLVEAYCEGCNFARASFVNANLKGAVLSGARADSACFSGAQCFGAAMRAIALRGADCRGANFHGADLTGALLDRCDLSDVNTRGTLMALPNHA
ncbi:DUF2169 domain-containing protein [Variovorax saccharolyticus]|uniref:DUF2169 domain-containing protein n=1 Tax=Variovorax saccharolyticus TaxID=3053516 RepID=UPI002577D231|nr:DUF2169 domain-containing protein [Variovorax sp. J31P216]MDM0030344.1 DUF2169 domain-containing protein [Variovorax sp. J31P216]